MAANASWSTTTGMDASTGVRIWTPIHRDTNGNLYQVYVMDWSLTEEVRVRKSTDDGQTWADIGTAQTSIIAATAEIDAIATAQQPDGLGDTVIGVVLYTSRHASGMDTVREVWHREFNCSDTGSGSDNWAGSWQNVDTPVQDNVGYDTGQNRTISIEPWGTQEWAIAYRGDDRADMGSDITTVEIASGSGASWVIQRVDAATGGNDADGAWVSPSPNANEVWVFWSQFDQDLLLGKSLDSTETLVNQGQDGETTWTFSPSWPPILVNDGTDVLSVYPLSTPNDTETFWVQGIPEDASGDPDPVARIVGNVTSNIDSKSSTNVSLSILLHDSVHQRFHQLWVNDTPATNEVRQRIASSDADAWRSLTVDRWTPIEALFADTDIPNVTQGYGRLAGTIYTKANGDTWLVVNVLGEFSTWYSFSKQLAYEELEELFTGTNGDPWPTGWTTSTEGSTQSAADIQSSRGRLMAQGSTGDFAAATSGEPDALDVMLEFDFQADSGVVSTADNVWLYAMVRSSGEQIAANSGRPLDAYYFRLPLNANATASQVRLYRRVNSGESPQLGGTITLPNWSGGQTRAKVKIQVYDQDTNVHIMLKMWDYSGTEPEDWDFYFIDTDAAALDGVSGTVQFTMRVNANGVYGDARIDNLVYTVLAEPAAGTNYDETGRTVAVTFTVSSTDLLAKNYDETGRSVAITFTTASTDDAAFDDTGRTVAATFATTSTDTAAFDETGRTVAIAFTTTSTDAAAFTDDVSVASTFTVTSTDVLAKNYDETGRTVAVTVAIASTDVAAFSDDTATAATFTVTSTDVAAFDEPNRSVSTTFTVASTDQAAFTDDTAVTATFTVTSTDVFTGTNYDETGRTVAITFSTSSTDDAAFDEAGRAVAAVITVTSTDAAAFDETGRSVAVAFTVSSSDTFNGTGFDETGRTVTFTITATSTDQAAFTDTDRPVAGVFAVASTDTVAFDETGRTVAILTDATSTDVAAFDETGRTVAVIFTVSSSDTFNGTNFDETGRSVAVAFTVTSTDQASYLEGATASIVFTVTSTDVYTAGGTNYDETGRTVSIAFSVASTDVAAYTEDVSVAVVTTITLADSLAASETPSVAITVTVTSTDVPGGAGQNYDETGRTLAIAFTVTATAAAHYTEILVYADMPASTSFHMPYELNILPDADTANLYQGVGLWTVAHRGSFSIVDDADGFGGKIGRYAITTDDPAYLRWRVTGTEGLNYVPCTNLDTLRFGIRLRGPAGREVDLVYHYFDATGTRLGQGITTPYKFAMNGDWVDAVGTISPTNPNTAYISIELNTASKGWLAGDDLDLDRVFIYDTADTSLTEYTPSLRIVGKLRYEIDLEMDWSVPNTGVTTGMFGGQGNQADGLWRLNRFEDKTSWYIGFRNDDGTETIHSVPSYTPYPWTGITRHTLFVEADPLTTPGSLIMDVRDENESLGSETEGSFSGFGAKAARTSVGAYVNGGAPWKANDWKLYGARIYDDDLLVQEVRFNDMPASVADLDQWTDDAGFTWEGRTGVSTIDLVYVKQLSASTTITVTATDSLGQYETDRPVSFVATISTSDVWGRYELALPVAITTTVSSDDTQAMVDAAFVDIVAGIAVEDTGFFVDALAISILANVSSSDRQWINMDQPTGIGDTVGEPGLGATTSSQGLGRSALWDDPDRTGRVQ